MNIEIATNLDNNKDVILIDKNNEKTKFVLNCNNQIEITEQDVINAIENQIELN